MKAINGRVEEIKDITEKMMQSNLHRIVANGSIEEQLRQIWDNACSIQRALAMPEVIQGYRADALAQVDRVNELLYELGHNPDDDQLRGLGCACDLAQTHIRTYLHMVAAVEKVNSTGQKATAEA
jgi:hypothetical protein